MRKRITAALTAFCLVLCLGASALALEPLGQPVQGMDVSAWQGEIDFEQVRAWGIRTVYIRAAVGQGRQDKDWRANYRKAKAAGLKVGLYHYVTARSQDQAREQAEFFAGLMEGLDMDCRPAMDFESFGDMSKEQINQAALAYVTRLERLCGGKPAVYSNSWTAAHVFDQRLADYPLWIAEYGPDQPREGGLGRLGLGFSIPVKVGCREFKEMWIWIGSRRLWIGKTPRRRLSRKSRLFWFSLGTHCGPFHGNMASLWSRSSSKTAFATPI